MAVGGKESAARWPLTLLCAVGRDRASANAVRVAIDIARRTGSQLRFLHVLTYVDGELDYMAGRRFMANIMSQAQRAGVASSAIFGVNDVGEAILNAADEFAADLIITGTHDRNRLMHWLLG